MSEDPRQDELNLGLLCFIAYRAMETRVLEALAAAGFDDLTTAQGRLAARIGPKGTRVTALAEQARVTKQTAGFLVNQLERAGYVRRVPDPADARARLVQIAPRGEAAVAIARVAEAEAARPHPPPRDHGPVSMTSPRHGASCRRTTTVSECGLSRPWPATERLSTEAERSGQMRLD